MSLKPCSDPPSKCGRRPLPRDLGLQGLTARAGAPGQSSGLAQVLRPCFRERRACVSTFLSQSTDRRSTSALWPARRDGSLDDRVPELIGLCEVVRVDGEDNRGDLGPAVEKDLNRLLGAVATNSRFQDLAS